jgi:hypothetical protein
MTDMTGIEELEQLLVDGWCSRWTQFGTNHTIEEDQRVFERKDHFPQGEFGRYAGFVQEFRKL